MIESKDRSYYIGASDTSYVIGNWETKTFERWWGVKLGIYDMDYESDAMKAGTAYEHKILDALGFEIEKDKQVINGRLRINLDGNTNDTIYEVKTHLNDFKLSKKYKEQVQVQMYSTGYRNAYIVAYHLTENDYINFYNDIDNDRISFHKIEYDENFINSLYLPNLNIITDCLEKGVFPKKKGGK